jgi:hypothetical protein
MGPRIRAPALGGDMTCTVLLAADPCPAFPIPRSEAAEQGVVNLSV